MYLTTPEAGQGDCVAFTSPGNFIDFGNPLVERVSQWLPQQIKEIQAF
jgi:hypothetical protein